MYIYNIKNYLQYQENMSNTTNCLTRSPLADNDLIRFIFNCSGSSAKDLIMWSLVSKQFYLCADDINLWKNFAQQHSITCCQTGQEVIPKQPEESGKSIFQPPANEVR
jgi:hypothetical protein